MYYYLVLCIDKSKMKSSKCDVLIENIGQLLTIPSPGRPISRISIKSLGIIENGYVAIKNGRIISVGKGKYRGKVKRSIDANGGIVLPGFVDPHTHLIFAGTRAHEFAMRLKGKSYLAIMKEGGGIKSTVKSTRSAKKSELMNIAKRYLDNALCWGTTTVEVKSGYGLSTSEELKILEVIALLQKKHPIDLIPTFLGAHDIPEEFTNNRGKYVKAILTEMLPEIAKRKLATFCDVFCEKGVFSKADTKKILKTASSYGLFAKIHADEFSHTSVCKICKEVDITTCDHLLYTRIEDLKLMGKAGTIAVLLPGANLFLMKRKRPPVDKMRKLGVPIAIGSDFNPGSSPIISMPVIISLACLLYGLTPEEAIIGATINAAWAVKKEDEVGSIEPGKFADITIMSIKNYEELPYWFATNQIKYVLKKGKIVNKRCN
ncbi:MAG: imidazolonepropionase [Candidatus Cloacimonas sp. 4484_209]|nr:MAG: imidazolonepropionase [Candidatus Cloacimonas sp. 4484_209]